MTFASVALPIAEQRWKLTGPAGAHTDALVAALLGAGVRVEPIVAGSAYRLDGPAEMLDVLGDELRPVEGFAVERETPPDDRVDMRSSLAPTHPPRRSVVIHGVGAAHSFVARAVDRRLAVAPVGVSRWSVSGRTAELVQWLAAIYCKSVDDVLALHGWTPESVAAEDSPTPTVNVANLPPVNVSVQLPERKTTSEIARDEHGDIVQVIQLETSTT